jgi:hypothetical protein
MTGSYLEGICLCAVAIVSRGTALVPLKLVGSKRNGVPVTTIALSGGYLLAASLAAVVMIATNKPAWSNSGLFGGLIWGAGKIFNILSVSGATGLAAGQGTQCSVNIGASFLVGVLLRGEPCSTFGAIGVGVLMAGLLAIIVPCPSGCQAAQPELVCHAALTACPPAGSDCSTEAAEAQSTAPSKSARAASLTLAASAGICFAFQSVPLLYDSSNPSALEYSVSQAVAQFGVILAFCVPPVVLARRQAFRKSALVDVPILPLVPQPCALLLAVGGGMLLFTAAASINVSNGILGLSVAQPLGNLNMMVAGCWGVFVFGEMPFLLERVRFFLACAVAIGGAVLLAV